jgi:hypothetical protein
MLPGVYRLWCGAMGKGVSIQSVRGQRHFFLELDHAPSFVTFDFRLSHFVVSPPLVNRTHLLQILRHIYKY